MSYLYELPVVSYLYELPEVIYLKLSAYRL
ncbi:MAG: hypothetical protein ACJAWL_001652 [Motiliproteus sp.]|jgi:hypothetical protein